MAFPYLADFIRYYTGLNIPLPVPMFGFWVAVAFLLATWVFKLEIQRHMDNEDWPKNIMPAADFANNICLLSAFSGIIGARIFHILEYPSEFFADPWGMLFSRGGYTILGGLILGIIVGVRWTLKKGFPVLKGLDAVAPAMIFGYAVGRIGCQLSGDGDWGIAANMALKPQWLPDFLWASQYKGNVLGEVIAAPGVYPTPLYESVAGFAIFGVLWWLRTWQRAPGWLFSAYLFLSGIERYFIESIRVNIKYNFGFWQPTQAELISLVIIAAGAIGLVYFWPPQSPSKGGYGGSFKSMKEFGDASRGQKLREISDKQMANREKRIPRRRKK